MLLRIWSASCSLDVNYKGKVFDLPRSPAEKERVLDAELDLDYVGLGRVVVDPVVTGQVDVKMVLIGIAVDENVRARPRRRDVQFK